MSMEVLILCCCGLDVHKKSVVACIRRVAPTGQVTRELRTFGTMTKDILELGDWLKAHGVTHVAMESTGVYWKPIYNLLEGQFELLLCNAQHIKQVPGRKTDVKDAEWIAQLLQHGLLRASFVPAPVQRELRDLTRHRSQLVGEKSRVANRIQKVLEDANIKLGSVASDVLGKSGRDMIQALIAGQENAEDLAELARRRLRSKIPQLREALRGHVTAHHRFMLKMLMEHLSVLEGLIAQCDEQVAALMPERVDGPESPGDALPFRDGVTRLTTIPGVDRRLAESIVAEIGTDMTRFPSADHLCSWAGICPGHDESAGKRRSGKTRKGNRWLRAGLSQAAWASAATKTYLGARYRRIARRRGRKRAVLAVGRTILVVAYHLLRDRVVFQDLGPDYFDRLDPTRLTRHLVRRLESLGHRVILEKRVA
jgi:transposase